DVCSSDLARPQLLVGGPLYEFHELDLALVGAGAQFGTLIVIRAPPFLRPLPPRLVGTVPQHFKAGETRQQGGALVSEFRKILLANGLRLGAKFPERRSQRAQFQFGNSDIVHSGALPQPWRR